MRLRALFLFGLIAASTAGLSKLTSAENVSVRAPGISAPVFQTADAFAVSNGARGYTLANRRSDTAAPKLKTGLTTPAGGIIDPGSGHDNDDAIAGVSNVLMPAPSLTFNGLSNYDNIDAFNLLIIPPDVNGDVGPEHYVQIVNSLFRVYDKNGGALTAPIPLSTLFAPLNTVCSTRNDGLPIVLYDPLADRWIISQYCQAFPPFRQMIAVSKTGDPTGPFYAYEFAMPNVRINDFPKFGVWPDGYYMSTEEFLGSDYVGTGMFAFDRTKMLAGDASAGYVYFNRPAFSTVRYGNILPADMDGLRSPAPGSPNIFAGFSATEYGEAADAIRLFEFRANFQDPLASTFTERPESPIAVAAFDPTSPPDRTDIAQPAPGERLDSNSDRLSYRLAYRNFGSSESLVVNQTVRISPDEPYRAGVRVYELRRSGGAFTVAEQATIGDTTASRWIGSVAQDHQGNIAVGYSYASENKRPSIFYTGRLASDPAGTYRVENSLADGTGVQKAFGWRWGDYAGLSVDPVDDCTFWQTGQYYTKASEDFSDFTWLTRIGRFKFTECTPTPQASIAGVVRNGTNGLPVSGVVIKAAEFQRVSSENGGYNLQVLPGTYSITVTARGFLPQTVSLTLTNGQSVVRDFSLIPVAVFENPGLQITGESCALNGTPEPGETVTVQLSLANTGLANATLLEAELLATGGVTNPSLPQNYGLMFPGGPTVSRPFTFTVAPSVGCGGNVTLTFRLEVGGSELIGFLVVTLKAGKEKIAFEQSFDRTPQAGLPVRWTRSVVDGASNWTVSAARSQSWSKSAHSPDPYQVGENELVTPAFRMLTPNGRVTFRNWYEFETTFLRNRLYDGSVMEIKIGNGPWNDVIAAGGLFESGGYDGLLDTCCQNPLGGRLGWSGRSGINQTSEFITTALRLPASTAGQLVQLRWRVGTDVGGTREGQYIDDLVVTDGYTCGCGN